MHRLKNALLITCCVCLYALLVDMAVETYQHSAIMKWWGVGTAVVATALLILLRRFLSVNKGLLLLASVNLGLMTACSWYPGGLASGLHGLTMNPAELYSALFAILAFLSLALVATWRRLPSEVRLVAAAIILYALTPFLLALSGGAQPFESLFRGGSFWTALPVWLQGAPLALFFAFPAGLLRIIFDLKRILDQRRWISSASLALAMSAGIAIGVAALGDRMEDPASNSATSVPATPAAATAPPIAVLPAATQTAVPAVPSPAATVPPTNTPLTSAPAVSPDIAISKPEVAPSPSFTALPPTGEPIPQPQVRLITPALPDGTAPLAAGEFYDSEPRISAEIQLSSPKPSSAQVRWYSVDAAGATQEIGRSTVRGSSAGKITAALEAPPQGFPLGSYKIEVVPDSGSPISAPFLVRALYPEGSDSSGVPEGLDIAPAALGGRIEFVSSENSDRTKATNLISRNLDYWDCSRCGWTSKEISPPPEVVFSFHSGRAAKVHAVVIDNVTEVADRERRTNSLPKYVEVFGSSISPGDGFQKLGSARLPEKLGRFVIKFPSQSVKFIKLRVISTYGDSHVRIAGVGIIEDPNGGPSTFDDLPRNVGRFELGGTVVRGSGKLGRLIDGDIEKEFWASEDNYLPQRLYFAFRNDQEALVDKLIFRQAASSSPGNWPKKVLVLTSSVGPLSGYEEVGEFSLAQSPAPQEIPIGKSARYLQIVVTENFGGSRTTFSEIEILEGKRDGYRSVLARNAVDVVAATAMQQTAPSQDPNSAAESEKNDFPAQANPLELGRFTKGRIDPLGENDFFKVSVPPGEISTVSFSLSGRPTLRTSMEILKSDGSQLATFDPGKEAKDRVDLTFAIEPGDHLIRLTQPPASLVVIWDTSGSMQGRSEDLRVGVEQFLSQVRPTERIQLISFSDSVKTLLPDFTSDIASLSGAAANQFSPSGGTAIYDAVSKAMELLQGKQGNRAIILMTDGADKNSRLAYSEFWNKLEKERIRLYTIGLGSSMREFNEDIGTTGERMLAHFAQATYGRFFYAEGSNQLAGFYKEITSELQSTTEYDVKATLSRGMGTLKIDSVGEKIEQVTTPEFQLILDASGSMRERKNLVEGRLKIDVAKDVMKDVIQAIPDDAIATLRVFGHRTAEGRKGDCEDSELMVPLARIDKPRYIRAVSSIKALGTTPLGYSLRQAAGNFSAGSGSKTIILITDGREECGDNPAQAVKDLRAQGLDVRVNVVGFDLAEESVKQQMREVASLTGGHFFDARGAAGLRDSILQALAVPFDVVDSAGKTIQSGTVGQTPISMPEGIYSVVIRTRGEPIRIPQVAIVKDRATSVSLKKAGTEIGTLVKMD